MIIITELNKTYSGEIPNKIIKNKNKNIISYSKTSYYSINKNIYYFTMNIYLFNILKSINLCNYTSTYNEHFIIYHSKRYFTNGYISHNIHFLNGNLHREDGPAYIEYNKNGKINNIIYCLNGYKHREDGPSKIWYDDNEEIYRKEYYLNDKKFSYKKYIDKINNFK